MYQHLKYTKSKRTDVHTHKRRERLTCGLQQLGSHGNQKQRGQPDGNRKTRVTTTFRVHANLRRVPTNTICTWRAQGKRHPEPAARWPPAPCPGLPALRPVRLEEAHAARQTGRYLRSPCRCVHGGALPATRSARAGWGEPAYSVRKLLEVSANPKATQNGPVGVPYLEEGTAGPEDSRRPPTPTRSPVAPRPGCGAKSPSKPRGDGRAGKKRSPCFLSLFLNPTLEGRGSQLEAMLPPADMSGDSFQCHSWAEEGASAASSRWRNAPCRAQDGPHGPPPQPSAVRAQDASPGGPSPGVSAGLPPGTPGLRQAAKGVTSAQQLSPPQPRELPYCLII